MFELAINQIQNFRFNFGKRNPKTSVKRLTVD